MTITPQSQDQQVVITEEGPDQQNRTYVLYCAECGSVSFGRRQVVCCDQEMEPKEVADSSTTPEFADLLRTVFEMNETELEICIVLMRAGPMTAEEVAAAIDCEPSYANRLLNHLQDIYVVEEVSSVLDNGGRVSTYRHASIEEIERAWKRELLCWTADALRVIEEEMVAEKERALESAEELVDELADEE